MTARHESSAGAFASSRQHFGHCFDLPTVVHWGSGVRRRRRRRWRRSWRFSGGMQDEKEGSIGKSQCQGNLIYLFSFSFPLIPTSIPPSSLLHRSHFPISSPSFIVQFSSFEIRETRARTLGTRWRAARIVRGRGAAFLITFFMSPFQYGSQLRKDAEPSFTPHSLLYLFC